MKKIGVVVFLSILLLGVFFAQQITKTEIKISGHVISELEQEDNVKVYIKLKDSSSKGIASDVKKDLEDSIDIKHEFEDKISTVISTKELEELKNNKNIESIEKIPIRKVFLQNSVPIINANDVWNSQLKGNNITGSGETVCILDTGINFLHSDLINKNLTCIIDCVSGAGCVENCSAIDWHGHGTHVAGIIGANGGINGVAKGVNLISIQVCNSNGGCAGDDTEAGIQWCVDNSDTYNISVISMSLGADCDTYPEECSDSYCDAVAGESDEIDEAVAKNISVVIATGNNGNTTHISEPACIQNATRVGAIAKDDSTFYYNRNNLVLLIAPGVSITSTYNNGGYVSMSGTSMSTPHVAGAIALINQFKRLQGNTILTPLEVEDALNDSGFRINDSGGSNIFYSRIDVLETLKELDSSAPEITLNSPSHNSLSSNKNQTFTCSATDALQLSNITFRLWDNTGELLNESTETAISNKHELVTNLTLEYGTYLWGCEAYDTKSNINVSTNYTLNIGTMALIINSPEDNDYVNSNLVNFNCSVEDPISNLTNITFYLWNASRGLIYNKTENISGNSNNSIFNYTLENEEAYEWNCKAYDEDFNSITEANNYTLNYDNTNPIISLISPSDDAQVSVGSITFSYSVADDNEIENCSLVIDEAIGEDDSSIDKNETETMSFSLSAESYDWLIKCQDVAGNIGTSSEWDLEVVASTTENNNDDSSSSGGGGGGGTSGTSFFISDPDFKEGINKHMKKDDSMKFNSSGEIHTLKVNSYDESSVKITIESDPISLTISIGGIEKVDLNNDNFYDVEVQYLGYVNTLAQIQIKEINEVIPIRTIQDVATPNSTETNGTIGTGEITSENDSNLFRISGKVTALWGKAGKIEKIILLGVVVLLILGLIVYFNKRKVSKKDVSKKKKK